MQQAICDNLDEEIEQYMKLGYRLDMIFPADAPREALLSEPPAPVGGFMSRSMSQREPKSVRLVLSTTDLQPPATAGGSDWRVGRAGLEYRDLIPDRLGGKVIASHIRLIKGGEVPDYVHYHKVDFQMIYCVKGRIKVVYEDQGPPFWLETGDCVLQPPEIRHRVLECTAGAEVIEVTMPAEHETWVEHEDTLPTNTLNATREFSGQRFVHSKFARAVWELSGFGGYEGRRTDIDIATNGSVNVQLFRPVTKQDIGETKAAAEPGKGLMIFMDDGQYILIDFRRET